VTQADAIPLRGVTDYRLRMIDRLGIEQRWQADGSKRDERGRRVFAASEARAAGRGGLAAVSQITGLARSTIGRGLADLDAPPPSRGRERREGGGPKRLTDRDPTLLEDLERLVEPSTLGDPERPLLWVSKSYDKLAQALSDMGHAVSASVRKLLIGLGFSRQFNRKADETQTPRRNAQFQHISAEVAARRASQPVISVDTKEGVVGAFKGPGDYRQRAIRAGESARLRGQGAGQGGPLRGLRPVPLRAGSASGSPPTPPGSPSPPFAPGMRMGREACPQIRELTITADGGGSNAVPGAAADLRR
jgi:hypothetical protein